MWKGQWLWVAGSSWPRLTWYRCHPWVGYFIITAHHLTLLSFSLPSTVCKGVSIGQWSLRSQKENQSGTKNAGTPVPAAIILRRKSPRKGFAGIYWIVYPLPKKELSWSQALSPTSLPTTVFSVAHTRSSWETSEQWPELWSCRHRWFL